VSRRLNFDSTIHSSSGPIDHKSTRSSSQPYALVLAEGSGTLQQQITTPPDLGKKLC
jgi:hypothetical protein